MYIEEKNCEEECLGCAIELTSIAFQTICYQPKKVPKTLYINISID